MRRLAGHVPHRQAFIRLSLIAFAGAVVLAIETACGASGLVSRTTSVTAAAPQGVSATIPAATPSVDRISEIIAELSTPEPLRPGGIMEQVVRSGVRPEGILADMDIVLATPSYLSITSLEIPTEMANQSAILFFVWENAHRELQPDPPSPHLSVDGKNSSAPVGHTVLEDDPHHRVTAIWFSPLNSAGRFIVNDESSRLDLTFRSFNELVIPETLLTWELPIVDSNGSLAQVIVGGDGGMAPPVTGEPGSIRQ